MLECEELDGWGDAWGKPHGAGGSLRLPDLQRLLPRGNAWPRRLCAVLTRLVDGLAWELEFLMDVQTDYLMDEADPRTAFETLDDWEDALALPGSCDTNYPKDTTGRRAAIAAKYLARGGQDVDYYQEIAQALGYTDLTFSKYQGFKAGQSTAGDKLYNGQWQYAVLVAGSTGSYDDTLRCQFNQGLLLGTTFVVELT